MPLSTTPRDLKSNVLTMISMLNSTTTGLLPISFSRIIGKYKLQALTLHSTVLRYANEKNIFLGIFTIELLIIDLVEGNLWTS